MFGSLNVERESMHDQPGTAKVRLEQRNGAPTLGDSPVLARAQHHTGLILRRMDIRTYDKNQTYTASDEDTSTSGKGSRGTPRTSCGGIVQTACSERIVRRRER